MANLRGIQGSSLVPDIGPALGILLQGVGTKRERDEQNRIIEQERLLQEQAAQKQTNIQEQIDILTTGGKGKGKRDANQQALTRLSALNPQIAKSVSDVIASGNQQGIDALKQQAELGVKQSAFVSGQPDFASKQRAIISLAEAAQTRGEPLDRFIEMQNLSEPELDLELERMKIMGTDLKTLTAPAKAAGARTVQSSKQLPGGLVQIVFKNGDVETVPGTPENVALIQQAEQRGVDLSVQGAGGRAGAVADVKLETAPKIKAATTQAGAEVTRTQGIIDRGLTAADSVPILNRTLELLDSVETGGFDAAALRAKQTFGIESADEAELSANLGKSVLSQLRTVFGAAFTENEGARLAKIEAAFGKSVAGNKRLLTQTKRIATRAADRAIKAAEKSGDTDTADEIRAALDFNLSAPDAPGQPAPVETQAPSGVQEGATATNPSTGQQLIFRGGQWQTL